MSELYFLRHGQRIDHALSEDPSATPIKAEYQPYDPSLATSAIGQLESAAKDILTQTRAFGKKDDSVKKNVFIHFSPYLRCCQSADLLVSMLKKGFAEQWPNYKIRFQLLGDFALSEWIHEKMTEKPPFVDSNDAYNMYIPNVKQLTNKSCCSTFRPTITLGHFNGPNLSYKDYQYNIKTYFKKLLAMYDKPTFIDNEDIVIVVSHGYVINNFFSYFINHPIFDEIPEARINYARREGDDNTWTLKKDSLDLLEKDPELNSTLNLETDIIYYRTNFIKKNQDTDPQQSADSLLAPPKRPELEPRTSFKVKSSPQVPSTFICNAARDWTPESSQSLQFRIKSDFKMKVMKDDSFKRAFDLQNHPRRPVTPEVSPNSEPTRSNSVIDLSKLLSNNEIYNPMKLKYSHAGDIPIHRLNSKVNSQVNLATLGRSPSRQSNNSSTNSSTVDLARQRSMSNPVSEVFRFTDETKERENDENEKRISSLREETDALQKNISSLKQETNTLRENISSLKEETDTLENTSLKETTDNPYFPPVEAIEPEILHDTLSRARSLNQKKSQATGKSLLAMYQQTHPDDSDSSANSVNSRLFSLGIAQKPRGRSRKNSLKFIPSLEKKKHIFYNLDSDASDDEDSEDTESSGKSGYVWFGENARENR